MGQNCNSLACRLQLLQLFFEAFGNELKQDSAEPAPQTDAKERLRELLDQIPVSEMLEMRFSKEMASECLELQRSAQSV